ncbi:MAG: phosphoglycerate dehydrogenase [Acidobacteriota bacterium]
MCAYRVLVCGNLSESGLKIFEQAKGIEIDRKPELNQEQLLNIIADYDGVVVRSDTRITAPVIAAGKRLKVIGRAGTGVDNIDVPAATQQGIVVMNTPGGNTITTGEHALALLVALARNIPQATASMKAGKWEKKKFSGVELFNKVLGIIGVGRIGGVVASRANGYGMRVIAYDPYLTREAAAKLNVELVSLDELYTRADFITIHTPLTAETRNLINKEALAKMKTGVRIINCARGGLIDETDLYDAIKAGKVAGAALDVFVEEPLPTNHPLLTLDEVICTPHLGASTVEAQVNVAVAIAEQVVDFLLNGTIRGAVNVPAINMEVLAQINPYIELGEKIGRFQGQAFGYNVKRIHIEYAGAVVEYDVRPITQAILVGLLAPTSERVNFVNASLVAEERGIRISESLSRRAVDFASMIEVMMETDNQQSRVAGALFSEKDLRIVRINGFHLEAIPKGHMLVCSNRDVPGVLGRFCTLLGTNGVNIGRLYLGRKEVGGVAIMLCQIDTPASDELLTELHQMPDILSAKRVFLP